MWDCIRKYAIWSVQDLCHIRHNEANIYPSRGVHTGITTSVKLTKKRRKRRPPTRETYPCQSVTLYLGMEAHWWQSGGRRKLVEGIELSYDNNNSSKPCVCCFFRRVGPVFCMLTTKVFCGKPRNELQKVAILRCRLSLRRGLMDGNLVSTLASFNINKDQERWSSLACLGRWEFMQILLLYPRGS